MIRILYQKNLDNNILLYNYKKLKYDNRVEIYPKLIKIEEK